MKINLSNYNAKFVTRAKEHLDIDEDTIVNNALVYYRAMKNARERAGMDIDNLKEFGKSEMGLLTGRDLTPYLFAVFYQEYMKMKEVLK